MTRRSDMNVFAVYVLSGLPTGVNATLIVALVVLAVGVLATYCIGRSSEHRLVSDPIARAASEEPARAEPAPRRHRTAAASAPVRAPLPNPASDRRTVLVVDDNATIVRFVERALSDTYAVRSATNGREALDVAAETLPDLIISDVMMPVMDGHELCRTVKTDPALRHVPVVFLTALASDSDLIDGLEMGSDDYIAKPFNVRELRARVRNLITARDEQRRLAEENLELSTVSEQKSDLLSLAAHDLKNPLTAIRELAAILKKEVGEESDAFAPADLIHQSSQQMLELISSLLESEAIEDGRIPVHSRSIDLAAVAADVVRRNDALARRKGQTIELRLPTGDCTVHADPHLLFEAMDNLVNNAVKYAPESSTVRVAVRRSENRVAFVVRDEGPGIDGEEQQHLFKKFHRLSSRPTGGESSSGLGLAIVKQIVELHQGMVTVDSEPGGGSTFSIELMADLEPAFADGPTP